MIKIVDNAEMKNNSYVVGIGAANVDIYGKPNIKIRQHYDHPATINSAIGGVCKNVLTALSKLDVKTRIITAVGQDNFGEMVLNHCLNNKINVDDCLRSTKVNTGVFMQVQDENNDMYLALCDMSAIKEIDEAYLNSKKAVLQNAKVVMFDPSLDDKAICELIKICKDKVDLYVDPISDNYAIKMRPYIKDLTCIKPNRSELENLSEIKINNEDDLIKACQKLLNQGLKKIYVSLGKDGILYMDNLGFKLHKKFKEIKNMVNASGAGDNAMAAIVYGSVNKLSVEETLDYSLAAGISAIIVPELINQDLSIDLLNKIIEGEKK